LPRHQPNAPSPMRQPLDLLLRRRALRRAPHRSSRKRMDFESQIYCSAPARRSTPTNPIHGFRFSSARRAAALTFSRSRRSSGVNAITASCSSAGIASTLSSGFSAHSHHTSKASFCIRSVRSLLALAAVACRLCVCASPIRRGACTRGARCHTQQSLDREAARPVRRKLVSSRVQLCPPWALVESCS
jgi:hypothetical protein